MNTVLYFTGIFLQFLAAVMTPFASGAGQILPALSSLLCSFLLLAVLTARNRQAVGVFLLSALSDFVILFYMFAGASWGVYLMAGSLVFYVVDLAAFFWLLKSRMESKWFLLAAFSAKTALLPEVILNTLLSRTFESPMLSVISWALLALTSLYAAAGLFLAWKQQRLTSSWTIACAALQFCFGADVVGCAIALFLEFRLRQKQQKEYRQSLKEKKEKKANSALYTSQTFNKTPRTRPLKEKNSK